ncbi:DUTPase [Fusarium albosuccineum]|uniref:dUTPase n=1 Tax=Fusarium albosuccineum TaxID=1237068 RepID=A0A8H4P8P2_9HYPO|nr:DUTPase [Fusarium albosuccineum]
MAHHLATLIFFALGTQASPFNQSSFLANDNSKGILFPKDADYAKATCAGTDITHPVEQIWSDTAATSAWNFVKDRWSQGPNRPDAANLNFTSYFSHQFHGPQLWECGTFGSLSNCVQTLGHCGDQDGVSGDVDVPAAYVIMNSFVQIHNLHQTVHDDLGNVQSQMQSQIGPFQSTFSPKKELPVNLWKTILDVLGFMTGFFYASVRNSVLKDVLSKVDISKHGELKDSYNTLISQAITTASRHLPANTDSLGIQNDLSSSLGSIAKYWQSFIATTNADLFSGEEKNLNALFGMINDGSSITQLKIGDQDVLATVEKLLYGYMIPHAWAVSPDDLHPAIIASPGDDCTSYAQPDTTSKIMNDDTAAKTHVCMDGTIYYVVNAKSNGSVEPLPGGTFDDLSSGSWGGVRLDDMVTSVVNAYKQNNNANGYSLPDIASLLSSSTGDDLLLTNGIQTPGFFNIPFCDSVQTFQDNLAAGNPSMKNWPCF